MQRRRRSRLLELLPRLRGVEESGRGGGDGGGGGIGDSGRYYCMADKRIYGFRLPPTGSIRAAIFWYSSTMWTAIYVLRRSCVFTRTRNGNITSAVSYARLDG